MPEHTGEATIMHAFCDHEWRPNGYVLSYLPAGRRYTVKCLICGQEGDREECEPGFSNEAQAETDEVMERALLGEAA